MFSLLLAAKEPQSTGITVNAIGPGIMGTQAWTGPDGPSNRWTNEGETMEESWKRHQDFPIRQGEAQASDVMGDLAVWLAASPHVTAQAINDDGASTSH